MNKLTYVDRSSIRSKQKYNLVIRIEYIDVYLYHCSNANIFVERVMVQSNDRERERDGMFDFYAVNRLVYCFIDDLLIT